MWKRVIETFLISATVLLDNNVVAQFREALIKSTRADLRRKFSLTRKKSAEILCVFQAFLTKFSRDFRCEDARGDLFRGSLDISNFYDSLKKKIKRQWEA